MRVWCAWHHKNAKAGARDHPCRILASSVAVTQTELLSQVAGHSWQLDSRQVKRSTTGRNFHSAWVRRSGLGIFARKRVFGGRLTEVRLRQFLLTWCDILSVMTARGVDFIMSFRENNVFGSRQVVRFCQLCDQRNRQFHPTYCI